MRLFKEEGKVQRVKFYPRIIPLTNFLSNVSLIIYFANKFSWTNACFEGHFIWTNEWMNEWMCIYIPHISHTVSRRFTILIEWDRTSACKGASGCRYQSIFDLTHPPSPCMKCTMYNTIYINVLHFSFAPSEARYMISEYCLKAWKFVVLNYGYGLIILIIDVISRKNNITIVIFGYLLAT